MALLVGKGHSVTLNDKIEEIPEIRTNDVNKKEYKDELEKQIQKAVKETEQEKENKLNEITIKLGWSGIVEEPKGLMKRVLKNKKRKRIIDLDMSVFMLDNKGKLRSNDDIIYFNNLNSRCGSVRHLGDSRVGKSRGGKNESIVIHLNKIPSYIGNLVLVSTIHGSEVHNKHFGLAKDAFVILNNSSTGKDILEFDLEDDFDGKHSVILAQIKRNKSGFWNFNGIGKGLDLNKLNDIKKLFI